MHISGREGTAPTRIFTRAAYLSLFLLHSNSTFPRFSCISPLVLSDTTENQGNLSTGVRLRGALRCCNTQLAGGKRSASNTLMGRAGRALNEVSYFSLNLRLNSGAVSEFILG